jgi:hypothetical protein
MEVEYGGANNRDFKNWLVSKEKLEGVVAAVEAVLGRQSS